MRRLFDRKERVPAAASSAVTVRILRLSCVAKWRAFYSTKYSDNCPEILAILPDNSAPCYMICALRNPSLRMFTEWVIVNFNWQLINGENWVNVSKKVPIKRLWFDTMIVWWQKWYYIWLSWPLLLAPQCEISGAISLLSCNDNLLREPLLTLRMHLNNIYIAIVFHLILVIVRSLARW